MSIITSSQAQPLLAADFAEFEATSAPAKGRSIVFRSRPVMRGVVMMFDAATVFATMGAAHIASHEIWGHGDPWRRDIGLGGIAAVLLVVTLYSLGTYHIRLFLRPLFQAVRVLAAWTAVWLLFVAFGSLLNAQDQFSPVWVMLFYAGGCGTLAVGRIGMAVAFRRWRSRGLLRQRVAILGVSPKAERLIEFLRADPDGFEIVGLFDDRKTRRPDEVAGCPVVGTTRELIRVAAYEHLDLVLVTLPMAASDRLSAICQVLKSVAVDARLAPEPAAFSVPITGFCYVGNMPMPKLLDHPQKDWYAVCKRIMDLAIVGTAGLMFLPLVPLIVAAIKLESRGPVLFRQKRFGLNSQTIDVLKFRTMYTDRGDASGQQRTVRNDSRITRVGRFLRRFSLDEVPQLLNVLQGSMSVVGPRAHAVAMTVGDRYYFDAVEEYAARHRVKPGLTGWAQINGLRGEIDTLEKGRRRVELDIYYIEHWSLWFDIWIILRTIPHVLGGDGAF